jgi:hypothetical protein
MRAGDRHLFNPGARRHHALQRRIHLHNVRCLHRWSVRRSSGTGLHGDAVREPFDWILRTGVGRYYMPSCRPKTNIIDNVRAEVATAISIPPFTTLHITEVWAAGTADQDTSALFSTFVDLKVYSDANGLPGANTSWLRTYGNFPSMTVRNGNSPICQINATSTYIFIMTPNTPIDLSNPTANPRLAWVAVLGASTPSSVPALLATMTDGPPQPNAVYYGSQQFGDTECTDACDAALSCGATGKTQFGVPVANTWVSAEDYVVGGNTYHLHLKLVGTATRAP